MGKKNNLRRHRTTKYLATNRSSLYTSFCEEVLNKNNGESSRPARKRSWDTSNDCAFENEYHTDNSKRRKWETNESFGIPHYNSQSIPEDEYFQRCLSPYPQNKINSDLYQQHSRPEFSWDEIRWTKTPSIEPQEESHDDTIYKLSIIPHDYPQRVFRKNEIDKIQLTIFGQLEAAPDPLPIISVGHITNVGVIPIICKGQQSLEFIESFNGKFIPGNIKLKVVDEKLLNKPIRILWKSYNTVCTHLPRVLNLIQRVNPGLDTSHWKIVSTRRVKDCIHRIVNIDAASAEHLKSKHYKIPDGLGDSVFTLLHPKSRKRHKKPNSSKKNISDQPMIALSKTQDSKPNKNSNEKEKNEQYVYFDGNASRTRLSWGELVERRIPLIDLTEEYSSYEGNELYTEF